MPRALALLVLLSASQVWGMEGQGNSSDHFTVGSSLGTAGISASTSNALRPYESARDDALAYVASAGDIRGARLESALRQYRRDHAEADSSDMQIALAIASLR
ncbi:Holliday junction resolvase [Ectopseudomonas mendocina]|uniref:Holliday junction resolvase n=1 Tax=Ectopseudomonas mendocina TaxID=300 RepID=A0A379IQI1_ECTME|nr:DUF2388 domain-containing protein [Pseudomonas mendocina]SUD38444.1 Holliday junction resolvase [Pseudomonas mendocina]